MVSSKLNTFHLLQNEISAQRIAQPEYTVPFHPKRFIRYIASMSVSLNTPDSLGDTRYRSGLDLQMTRRDISQRICQLVILVGQGKLCKGCDHRLNSFYRSCHSPGMV